MSSDAGQKLEPADAADEKQLCLSCVFPNEPSAHFCSKCGAPLSSYAATGPFEQLFAEGHIYRQAAERPRRLIVVLGIWLIFGMMGLTGFGVALAGRDMGFGFRALGGLMMAVSVVLVWKTTRNYLTRSKVDVEHDG